MSIQITYITPLIEVFNMRRSLEFYRDILGFEVHMDSGGGDDADWVWIQKDGTHLMLNGQYEPEHAPAAPPDERTKWHKDTCLYLGCANPDAIFEFLRSKGVILDPPMLTPYGMKHLYLKDPDGYGICFQCPAESPN